MEENKNTDNVSDTGRRFMGVHSVSNRTWGAQVFDNKCQKYIYVGSYNTPEKAAMAYDNKARELYGSQAMLNFPTHQAGSSTGLPGGSAPNMKANVKFFKFL